MLCWLVVLLSVVDLSPLLSADACEARPVDICGLSGEHIGVDAQILQGIEFADLRPHGLRCISLAHILSFLAEDGIVDASGGVVAPPPANCDVRVVAK